MKKLKLSDVVDAVNNQVLTGDLASFAADPEAFIDGDVTVDVSPEDYEVSFSGAPVSRKVAAVASSVAPSVRATMGPEQVSRIAQMKKMGAVGAGVIERANFPLVLIENGELLQSPISASLTGKHVAASILRAGAVSPHSSIRSAAAGAGAALTTSILVNVPSLASGGVEPNIPSSPAGGISDSATPAQYLVAVPIVFVDLSSSTLNAAPGAPLQFRVVGRTEYGVGLCSGWFTFSRKDVSKPTRLAILPFTLSGDVPTPAPAYVGTLYGMNLAFQLEFKGVEATTSIALEMPGRDSRTLQNFLSSWGLSQVAK